MSAKDFDLKSYLETLVNKLSLIRSNEHDFSKEVTYSEALRFVRNCEKLELDYDFLVTNKIMKYLHIAYMVLLAINDTDSLGYQQLLPRLSSLKKACQKTIMDQVSSLLNLSLSSMGL